jgi:hypothetical protein
MAKAKNFLIVLTNLNATSSACGLTMREHNKQLPTSRCAAARLFRDTLLSHCQWSKPKGEKLV